MVGAALPCREGCDFIQGARNMKVSVRMLEPENKKEAMMPRITGPGSAVSYDSWFGATRRIRWVSRRTDESGLAAVIRDPS